MRRRPRITSVETKWMQERDSAMQALRDMDRR